MARARRIKVDGDPRSLIAELESMGSEENRLAMARFGIRPARALGVSMTSLRTLARGFHRHHALAVELWASGIHEARLLATLLDEVDAVTPQQMDAWAGDFDSWDICDQACANLFDRTPHAVPKAWEWTERPEEYVRRAGFVLMATLAVHDRSASDSVFVEFLPALRNGMGDERNFVKKAVSWSFRQIAKRSSSLGSAVLDVTSPLVDDVNKTVRWIARDVTRELLSRQ
jgi:3-methyladenine DNA glycosylase AlkD